MQRILIPARSVRVDDFVNLPGAKGMFKVYGAVHTPVVAVITIGFGSATRVVRNAPEALMRVQRAETPTCRLFKLSAAEVHAASLDDPAYRAAYEMEALGNYVYQATDKGWLTLRQDAAILCPDADASVKRGWKSLLKKLTARRVELEGGQ